MRIVYDELSSKDDTNEATNKLVHNITTYIKYKHDYSSAINVLLQNNLKMHDIVSRTGRLTTKEIVELANQLILIKKFKK